MANSISKGRKDMTQYRIFLSKISFSGSSFSFSSKSFNNLFGMVSAFWGLSHGNSIDGLDNGSSVAGGFQGISLTGEPINKNNFKHNNMVPFFGGSIKQNVDDNANRSKLENFTGSMDNYQSKKKLPHYLNHKLIYQILMEHKV